MSRTIEYNANDDAPAFKNFRITLSNRVLVQAVEDLQRNTGMSERELAKEAIVSYLEEQQLIKLRS